eukprot:XP_011669193.1 PREDICTED: uncharacterized protein LOC105440578 [Strongylocentrotus purpuratus]
MYSVNDELPEGFFDGHHTGTRSKKTRVPSSKSGRSSKQQYIIKEEANDNDSDDDDEMKNSRHRMRLRIVAVALVFTVAALIAFGVALYFSSMEDPSVNLEPVIAEDEVPSPN